MDLINGLPVGIGLTIERRSASHGDRARKSLARRKYLGLPAAAPPIRSIRLFWQAEMLRIHVKIIVLSRIPFEVIFINHCPRGIFRTCSALSRS